MIFYFLIIIVYVHVTFKTWARPSQKKSGKIRGKRWEENQNISEEELGHLLSETWYISY